MAEHGVYVERVYDEVRAVRHPDREPDPPPGMRFLVDRLWPRGVSRDVLAEASWLKEVAPSDELRRWFGHDPGRFEEFAKRYRAQLDDSPEALEPILRAARKGPVTLLYAAKDTEHNHALVLRDHLRRELSASAGGN